MKFTVTRTDGTDNSGKTYLVVNTDEPYAGEVADMIEKEERRKGTWEHGDKHLREVMGIPKKPCLGKSTCGGCDPACESY